jgi:Fe-S cluster assembly ATP-binding protein
MSASPAILSVRDLHVSIEGREVVRGISLDIRAGERHAIMGPNGSGKSSLANALMGNPAYQVTGGTISLNGTDITGLPVDQRSRMGLFLGFQVPIAVPGVSVSNFIRSALKARLPKGSGDDHEGLRDFRKRLTTRMKDLGMDSSFAMRYLNEGFSGGEAKRLEILQMAMLEPAIAVLDEPDSGLDIDAVKVVARNIAAAAGPQTGLIVVTHYQRILEFISPGFVHVLVKGNLVRSGGPELARELETSGYDSFLKGASGA